MRAGSPCRMSARLTEGSKLPTQRYTPGADVG
jgi:hypothetical protein